MDLIGLENLERLDLKGNFLTFLSDDLFADMKKLRIINFGHNKLERLSSKLLEPSATSLECASFGRNTKVDDFFKKNDESQNLRRLMDIMILWSPQYRKLIHSTNQHHQQMAPQLHLTLLKTGGQSGLYARDFLCGSKTILCMKKKIIKKKDKLNRITFNCVLSVLVKLMGSGIIRLFTLMVLKKNKKRGKLKTQYTSN